MQYQPGMVAFLNYTPLLHSAFSYRLGRFYRDVCIESEPQSTHRVAMAMATFWRTFHHDVKIRKEWVEKHLPFCITQTYSAEMALPVF